MTKRQSDSCLCGFCGFLYVVLGHSDQAPGSMYVTVPLGVRPCPWLLWSPVLLGAQLLVSAGPVSLACGQPTCEQEVEFSSMGMCPRTRRLFHSCSLWGSLPAGDCLSGGTCLCETVANFVARPGWGGWQL